ncbi:lipopolysaccharide biosynthesis protein [Sphingoaurantiacus capsulatus]|uniref:Lipopolysaccharide biosynthesis protein n=1 Tax=Sphingoaurantiacus capsulatus TaxID=1771310 RepID=A0ABV7XBM6_9SPHN
MKGLARDTVIYGLAAALSRGLALLVLPIYTRVLAPSEYGALDTILVIATLAALVVPLEISQALARLLNDLDDLAARRRMASTALWFTAGAYLLAFAVAIMAAPWVAAQLLGGAERANIFRLGAAFIAVSGIFFLMQNQLRFELRSKDYAIASSVYAVLTLSFGIAFGFGLELGLAGILIAQLLAATVAVAVGALLLRDTYAFSFDSGMLRTMLGFSAPLVPSALATFVTLYGNRLLLNTLMGLGAVGVFGVATRIATMVTLPILGFQAALTPLIYAHYREAETPVRLARIMEGFVAVALGGCLGLGLFADEALLIFADAEYAAAAPFIMALAPAAVLSQMYIFFPGLAIARKTHWQLYIFILSASGSLLANWLLIDAFGVPGAAIATLGGGLLFMALWVPASQHFYRLPIRWIPLSVTCLAAIAVAMAGTFLATLDLGFAYSISSRVGLLAAFAAAAGLSGMLGPAPLRSAFARIRRSL